MLLIIIEFDYCCYVIDIADDAAGQIRSISLVIKRFALGGLLGQEAPLLAFIEHGRLGFEGYI
ncbi:hypothetical protein D3C77_696200 [compost metagenome]